MLIFLASCFMQTSTHPGGMVLAYLLMGSPVVAVIVFIVWDRRYRQVWQTSRSKNWQRVEGKFDEGEVVTMKKGRTDTIIGYSVWFSYEYGKDPSSGEPYVGLFTTREFPEKKPAEEYRKRLENKTIPIRVSPRNAKRSCVIAADLPTDQ